MAGRLLLTAGAARIAIGRSSKRKSLRLPQPNHCACRGERGAGGPVAIAYSRAMATAIAQQKPIVKVAVGQMTATGDLDANFRTCARLVEGEGAYEETRDNHAPWPVPEEACGGPAKSDHRMAVSATQIRLVMAAGAHLPTKMTRFLATEAAAAGAKLLSLPECFNFIGSRQGAALAIAEPLDGPIMARYQGLARESGLWLALGGFQEKGPDEGHSYNTHVLLDGSGVLKSVYRKIHLFDVDIPGGAVLKESQFTAPGSQIAVVDSPIGRLGMTVCYDLRFPELYQQLRFKHNAQVMLVPSAFTKKTGTAHWETLLRARAIETQCYVIAAAQAGVHNEKRESYGDSIIVDPWGTVIARCADKLLTGIAVADIDLSLLESIRLQIPIEQHRRYDIYGIDSTPARSQL